MKGFEYFLAPTPFETLRTTASNGPVVVLNVSRLRSDAIIIISGSDPVLVPLPEATPHAIMALAEKAHNGTSDGEFKALLSSIWKLIVRPVVDVLQAAVPNGSRIWWCPTGPASLLPLHAAGEYNKRGQSLPSLYISSYTPTLSVLLRARRSVPVEPGAESRMLVIGQSNAKGQHYLPSVPIEINRIRVVAPNATTLEDSNTSAEAILNAMELHPRIHLSCHGHMNHQQPFLSQFSLYDEPLTVSDIVRRNLSNAELAFLSACHSAASNKHTPDEALHLTASLQFAGFRSVVGTLWAMPDEYGPDVAEAFYSNLLGTNEPKAPSSAHALHRAVANLRRRRVPTSQWACFVHFGC